MLKFNAGGIAMSWKNLLKKDIYDDVRYYIKVILELGIERFEDLYEMLKHIETLILKKDMEKAQEEFANLQDRLKRLEEIHTSARELEYNI
jgi:predicted transcriptional regulator